MWQETNYFSLDLTAVKVFLDNLTSVTGLVTHVYFYKDELTLKRSFKTVLKGIVLLANCLEKAECEKPLEIYVSVALLHKSWFELDTHSLVSISIGKQAWLVVKTPHAYPEVTITCYLSPYLFRHSRQCVMSLPGYSSKILATGVSRQQMPTMYLNSSSHLTS